MTVEIAIGVPTRTPAFHRDIRVYTAGGKEAEIFIAQIGNGDVAICANGGLEPGTQYYWTAGPFRTKSINTLSIDFDASGVRTFTTDDRSDNAPITSWLACSGVDPDVYSLLRCEDEPGDEDTGESGDTGDTGL